MGVQLNVQTAMAEFVLKALQAENMPWRSNRGIPKNPQTGNKYSGINLLILDTVATERNYRSKWWATYQQWHSIGMQVERRPKNATEWGVPTVNWQNFRKIVDKGDILSMEQFGRMQKHTVFNAEQVFGCDLKKYLITLNEYSIVDYSSIDSLIAATDAIINHEESCTLPHYHRHSDEILLPLRSHFLNDRQYFATKIHELFHWAESRLGWTGSVDQGEFIAEIGTGYLEAEFDLPHDSDMSNCRKWLPDWICGIKQNPKYLFDAAAQAARTIEYFFGLQSQKLMVE